MLLEEGQLPEYLLGWSVDEHGKAGSGWLDAGFIAADMRTSWRFNQLPDYEQGVDFKKLI